MHHCRWLLGILPDYENLLLIIYKIDWYDVNATNFIQYLEDFHNTFNLPLWVTEWSCQNFNGGPQCTEAEIFQFLNITQSFMDATDWVERYAWFGVMENLQGVNEVRHLFFCPCLSLSITHCSCMKIFIFDVYCAIL